jgi:hypothetical protein
VLCAVRIEMENYFPHTYHGLSMLVWIEPPLILVQLLQEWSRIKALRTDKRKKDVRSNSIHMGKSC